MPVFDMQADPLGFMSFLNNSAWTVVELNFSEGEYWGTVIDELNDLLEDKCEGLFTVSLGNESKLTDNSAEYIIRTELDSDLANVSVVLVNYRSTKE